MKKLFAMLMVGAMALTATGCGSNEGNASKNNTFTVGQSVAMDGKFNPLYYTSSYDGDVINLVYESLLVYDANDELVPSLATEMPTIGDDGLTLTFKIREGAQFSDKTPLTSSDVKYTFTIASDKSYNGRMRSIVANIKGYDEYHNGTAKEVSGIETPDETTVKITLKQPQIDAVANFGTVGIMSDEQFDYKQGDTKQIQDNLSNPVGSGPYVLNKFDKSTGASLVKNKNYNGKGEYAVENIIIKKTDTATDYDELKNGSVDLIPMTIEQNKVGPASLNENIAFNHYKRAGIGNVALNAANGATKDIAVRKALSYATDRQAFVDNFYKYEEAGDSVKDIPLGYVPQVYWNPASKDLGDYVTGEKKVEGLVEYPYSIEKANQILDEAGWVKGSNGIRSKDGQPLEIKFLASSENPVLDTLLPMIQKTWKEIGADVKVSTLEFNSVVDTAYDNKKASEWNVLFLATGYTGVMDTDGNRNYEYQLDADGNIANDNITNINDKEINEILAKAYYTNDTEVSKENYLKAMERASELAIYIPLYGNEYFDLYNKRVQGLETSPVHPWSLAMDKVTLK